MKFDHRYVRSEFDWLAKDEEGYLAFFTTAGRGPIPAELDNEESDAISVQEYVLGLPLRGDAIPVTSREADLTDWLEAARRGLFAFDWDFDRQQYELIAKPSSPIQVAENGQWITIHARFSLVNALRP